MCHPQRASSLKTAWLSLHTLRTRNKMLTSDFYTCFIDSTTGSSKSSRTGLFIGRVELEGGRFCGSADTATWEKRLFT